MGLGDERGRDRMRRHTHLVEVKTVEEANAYLNTDDWELVAIAGLSERPIYILSDIGSQRDSE